MLACGEHTFVWRRVSNPWLLPVPKIVGENNILHSQLIECHNYVKELISDRLTRCRDLLSRCRTLPCFDARDALEADSQIQHLENVIDMFVTKWSIRVRRWSYSMGEDKYAKEVHQLFDDVTAFKESVLKIEAFVQSLNSTVERYVRSGYVPNEVSLYEELFTEWMSAACEYLSLVSHNMREYLKTAVLFGGVWIIFAIGCWAGLYVKKKY